MCRPNDALTVNQTGYIVGRAVSPIAVQVVGAAESIGDGGWNNGTALQGRHRGNRYDDPSLRSPIRTWWHNVRDIIVIIWRDDFFFFPLFTYLPVLWLRRVYPAVRFSDGGGAGKYTRARARV